MKNNIVSNDKYLKGKILSSRVYPEFFLINPNERIINIGCGNGSQAIVYAGKYKEMIGVDINKQRLEKSEKIIKNLGINNYSTIRANVEKIPLPNNNFEKAIAIDIIEHVQNPKKLCFEANRLLKKDGQLLITFPATHDKFMDFASKIGSILKRKKTRTKNYNEWNPDEHNHRYSLKKWIMIVENCGFEFRKSRATTMFPPLHLYGIPRFWFSNNLIHKIDSLFCKIPILKNCGQTLICIFKKSNE